MRLTGRKIYVYVLVVFFINSCQTEVSNTVKDSLGVVEIKSADCITYTDTITGAEVKHCIERESENTRFKRSFIVEEVKIMQVNYNVANVILDSTHAIFEGNYLCVFRYLSNGAIKEIAEQVRLGSNWSLNRKFHFDTKGNLIDSLGRGLVLKEFKEVGDSVLISGIIWDEWATSLGERITGYSLYLGEITVITDTSTSTYRIYDLNVDDGKFHVCIPKEFVSNNIRNGGNIISIWEFFTTPDGQKGHYNISVPFVDPLFTKDYKFPYHALKNSYKNILQYLDSRKEEIFNPESFKQ